MTRTSLRSCPQCSHNDARVKFVEDTFIVVKCRKCRLVYLGNPPESDRLYDDYYGATYPSADAYISGSPIPELSEIHSINEQRIGRIHEICASGRLLDIGCGRGHFLKTAKDNGYNARGIDISTTAVEYAQREFGLDAEIRTMDNLAGLEGAFDIVTMWHVLEHFSDPFQILRLVHSLLAPSGHCFIEVPNLRSAKFILSRNKWQGGNHPLYHRTFFTAGTLRGAIQNAGFGDTRRLRISYQLAGRNAAYEGVKKALNRFAMDAFLDYVAAK